MTADILVPTLTAPFVASLVERTTGPAWQWETRGIPAAPVPGTALGWRRTAPARGGAAPGRSARAAVGCR